MQTTVFFAIQIQIYIKSIKYIFIQIQKSEFYNFEQFLEFQILKIQRILFSIKVIIDERRLKSIQISKYIG